MITSQVSYRANGPLVSLSHSYFMMHVQNVESNKKTASIPLTFYQYVCVEFKYVRLVLP